MVEAMKTSLPNVSSSGGSVPFTTFVPRASWRRRFVNCPRERTTLCCCGQPARGPC